MACRWIWKTHHPEKLRQINMIVKASPRLWKSTDPQGHIKYLSIKCSLSNTEVMKTRDLRKCICMCIPTDRLCSQQLCPSRDSLSLIHELYRPSYWNNKTFYPVKCLHPKNSKREFSRNLITIITVSRFFLLFVLQVHQCHWWNFFEQKFKIFKSCAHLNTWVWYALKWGAW